jgi:hypothetical protein
MTGLGRGRRKSATHILCRCGFFPLAVLAGAWHWLHFGRFRRDSERLADWFLESSEPHAYGQPRKSG